MQTIVCLQLDFHYVIGIGAHLVIIINLAQASWCIKEVIRILLQALMKTECNYKTVQVILSISPLSMISVHSTVSPFLRVSTAIALIKNFLTIYGASIWITSCLTHKEHCITLLTCFLKKLLEAKKLSFGCFQHLQVSLKFIILGYCERILMC